MTHFSLKLVKQIFNYFYYVSFGYASSKLAINLVFSCLFTFAYAIILYNYLYSIGEPDSTESFIKGLNHLVVKASFYL